MTSVILVCGAVPVVSHRLPPLILHNSSLTALTDAQKLNRNNIRFHGRKVNVQTMKSCSSF